MPLYLTEADVTALLTPADAVAAVEGSFERLARGAIDNRPRQRMPLEEGVFAVMSAVDHELGYAGVKSYAWLPGGTPFVVLLFSVADARLEAVIEADALGRLRTGAASGVAAKYLAREGATTLGVIGTGWQAGTQVECIRAAVPTIEKVVAYGRNADKLAAFGLHLAEALVVPYSTLWFVYLLAVFSVVTKLLHRRVPPALLLVAAAVLQILPTSGLPELLDRSGCCSGTRAWWSTRCANRCRRAIRTGCGSRSVRSGSARTSFGARRCRHSR